jgi:hypothetical protein
MHRDFNQALQTIEMALTLSCTEEIDKELEEFKKRIYRKMKSNIIAQNRDEVSLYRWLKTYSY